MAGPVRVLLVDEWAVAAEQLRRDLGEFDGLTVVGVARTAEQATRLLADGAADVAAVDVAVRGGTAAVGEQVPVVAVCGDDRADLSAALYAVEGGAVDLWVRTPDVTDLAVRLTVAATTNPARPDLKAAGRRASGSAAGALLAIAAGVGGTVSLGTLLAGLPGDAAGVVVTNLPAEAVGLWVERTNRRSGVSLAVASGVDRVAPGRLWVARGGHHLTVRPAVGGGLAVVVRDGPAVGGHVPSFDVMWSSVAEAVGPHAVGVVLGGGGTDGVTGLVDLREAGGQTAAESPATAACGQLPTAALHYGGAQTHASAEHLAALVVSMVNGRRTTRAA